MRQQTSQHIQVVAERVQSIEGDVTEEIGIQAILWAILNLVRAGEDGQNSAEGKGKGKDIMTEGGEQRGVVYIRFIHGKVGESIFQEGRA